MTNIKKTINKTEEIITTLITKLDIANLGNWAMEKQELTKLLTYLQDKSQPKPTDLTEEIEIDLGEIANLEASLDSLTAENTRLTNENANLQTKTSEQDGIITGTTIPELIAKLEQYANKVSDSELKANLSDLKASLTALQQTQAEIAAKSKQEKFPTWSLYTILGTVIFFGLLISYQLFFGKNKKDGEIYGNDN